MSGDFYQYISYTDILRNRKKVLRIKKTERNIVIGIPRALHYERYHVLWHGFWEDLGVKVITSPETNRQIMENGMKLAIDETCLSLKIFIGHVNLLLGTCDYIMIPRICNLGKRRDMCTRFYALYDLCRNVFRDSPQKFITYNLDMINGNDEEQAMTGMALSLGFTKSEAHKAYKKAKKKDGEAWKNKRKEQEARYKSNQTGILLAGHSYVIEDAYIGRPITEALKKLGVTVIRGDISDRSNALKQSEKLSPTMRWEINREIVGNVYENKDHVDGIILLSVFPCAPDSMTNEMIVHKIKDVPILNLVLDGQSGVAGVETRLESFVDILNFKGGRL